MFVKTKTDLCNYVLYLCSYYKTTDSNISKQQYFQKNFSKHNIFSIHKTIGVGYGKTLKQMYPTIFHVCTFTAIFLLAEGKYLLVEVDELEGKSYSTHFDT